MNGQRQTERRRGRTVAMAAALTMVATMAAVGCSDRERQQMSRETARTAGTAVDTGGTSATIYRADSGRVPATHMDVRLEAPTQLPALQQRLDSLQRDPGYLQRTSYAAGYTSLLADAINAMESDLARVRAKNLEQFRSLIQEVLRNVGAGSTAGKLRLESKDVPQHVAGVRRLIAMYEDATHAPLNPSAQPPQAQPTAGDSAASAPRKP